jgi:hypothetical protein
MSCETWTWRRRMDRDGVVAMVAQTGRAAGHEVLPTNPDLLVLTLEVRDRDTLADEDRDLDRVAAVERLRELVLDAVSDREGVRDRVREREDVTDGVEREGERDRELDLVMVLLEVTEMLPPEKKWTQGLQGTPNPTRELAAHSDTQ